MRSATARISSASRSWRRALLEEAEAFAHRVAAFPRVGVKWTKHGLHRALDSDFASATRSDEEAELACFRSPDTRERLSEFVDRKRP